jgi:hypothetical protein
MARSRVIVACLLAGFVETSCWGQCDVSGLEPVRRWRARHQLRSQSCVAIGRAQPHLDCGRTARARDATKCAPSFVNVM